jgi:hypothetical protein
MMTQVHCKRRKTMLNMPAKTRPAARWHGVDRVEGELQVAL